MKFTASALVLFTTTLLATSGASAAAASEGAAANGRRSLRLDTLLGRNPGSTNTNPNTDTDSSLLQKRVPLDSADLARAKMVRRTRRSSSHPSDRRSPSALAEPAAFGAIPMMDTGVGAIVGVTKRSDTGASMGVHNGQIGSVVAVSNAASVSSSSSSSASSGSSSSDNSSSSAGSSTSGDGADSEGCEEVDDTSAEGDEEDCEEEDDTGDEEDCEEVDETDGEEEDCEEEDDSAGSGDSTSSTTSSDAPSSTASASDSSTGTADKATSNAVVNIKGPSNDSSKSSSSSKSSEPSKASSSSSSAASSTKSPSSTSSASSGDYTGIATWYTQNGNAGACGKYNPDSAKIIALYTSVYGDGSKCGKTVRITNLDDGGSVDAVVADMCPSCGGPGDIDLSVGTFKAIDPEYQQHGVRNIAWHFLD